MTNLEINIFKFSDFFLYIVVGSIRFSLQMLFKTRIDVYETLCPQQMLVHKGGKIKNWGGECRDVTPTNCSLKIYLKRALGGGGGGGGVGLEGSGWM